MLILSLLFECSIAVARPSINIQTKYYPVFGSDSASIRRSIQQNGPVGKFGKRYHAQTQWDIKWDYRWIQSHATCRLTQVNVGIDIEYLLPELQSLDSLQNPLSDDWDNYFQALFKHEQQHKNYGVHAARELEQKLLTVPPQSCSALETKLADTAKEVLDKYDQLEKNFDRETDHGTKQGIILP